MTCNELSDLLELLPAGITLDGELPAPAGHLDLVQKKLHRVRRFARAYANLQFGWHYVCALTNAGAALCPHMRRIGGPELTAAYHYLAHDVFDPHIFEAVMIAVTPERAAHRKLIHSALLARDFVLTEFCQVTGMSPRVVTVYEKLFFNILDRKHDAAFVTATVYPETRLVEMFDGYLSPSTADVESLLHRAGHNNGMADVLHLAGFQTDTLSALSTADTTEKLELLIMANGLLLARNGWLNQRSHAAGFNNARSLITAAKMGGAEKADANNSPFASLGATFQQEMIATKRAEAKDSLSLAKQVHEENPSGPKIRGK